MLQASIRCLKSADSLLSESSFRAAAIAADDGLAALPASPPQSLRLALLNVHGVALHLLGDLVGAHETLSDGLDVALASARSGTADDDYIGLGGVMTDLAANHVRRGDVHNAASLLKRSKYMLARAYRPSDLANACLHVCTGLMHEASGAYDAALDSQQSAHTLLCTPSLAQATDSFRLAGWTQAARAGSIWAMLRLERTKAAEVLALADLDPGRMQALGIQEQAFSQSLASIATLERMQEPSERACDGCVPSAAHRVAATRLHAVADALSGILGEEHEEVMVARLNSRRAQHALVGRPDGGAAEYSTAEQLEPWTRHWQPALGAGIAAALSQPAQRKSPAQQQGGDGSGSGGSHWRWAHGFS